MARTIPSSIQTQFDDNVTTLVWCWVISRNDGIKLGFTDHDKDIQFLGVTCKAGSGFSPSDISESVGLSVSNLDVTGVLQDDAITESDIASGLYDTAQVDIYLVDWTNPQNYIVVQSATIGDITRSQDTFVANLVGVEDGLNKKVGRKFQSTCDAELGDTRCTVDVTSSTYSTQAQISSITTNSVFTLTNIDTYPDGWFSRGVVLFTSGQNINLYGNVKSHSGSTITLWTPVPRSLSTGDSVTITAGCDKSFSTCVSKFGNHTNFQGFPHIPGNDYLSSGTV